MTDNESRSIKSDEDWKDRVKAEDARLDAERASESRGAEAAAGSSTPADPDEDTDADESAHGATDSADAAATAADADSADIDPAHLPPPRFTTLVSMLSSQALLALGMLPDPSTGQLTTRLNLARHFIDLLAALEEKTRGNLDPTEQRLLDSTLHELRMAFVEMSRR